TAGTACLPSETAATTSMSPWRPSRSSSASENTWLSSTRRTRIRPATGRRLFRRQEERVVRLSSRLDVDLERGIPLRQEREQCVELGLVGPGQHRQDAARLGEEPLGHRRRDQVEVSAACDGLLLDEPEELPRADGAA